VRANAWGKEQEDRLLKECSEAINQAVDDYLATPAPATEAMFDHLYAQLPDAMREQRATALRFAPTRNGVKFLSARCGRVDIVQRRSKSHPGEIPSNGKSVSRT
jgi:predicted NAD/FAD-dependent oxidoreductase